VGGPVFAENLQALTFPFAIATTPLSNTIAIRHSRELRGSEPWNAVANYYRNTQLSIGKCLAT
jgi:hypothetical protein